MLAALGNASQQTLIVGVMLALVGIYLIRTLFLVFLAYCQMRFAYGVQTHLSQCLFEAYLRQP